MLEVKLFLSSVWTFFKSKIKKAWTFILSQKTPHREARHSANCRENCPPRKEKKLVGKHSQKPICHGWVFQSVNCRSCRGIEWFNKNFK